jgi:hypothetical protein
MTGLKGVSINDLKWVIDIVYHDGEPDSELHISVRDYPWILSALSHALNRIRTRDAHIIGIRQEKY